MFSNEFLAFYISLEELQFKIFYKNENVVIIHLFKSKQRKDCWLRTRGSSWFRKKGFLEN